MDHAGPVRTIDLGRWRVGTPDERASVAADFDASMRDAGFALLVGGPVPASLPAELRAAATQFFELPEPTKEPYRTERLGTRGWIPFGLEANAYASGGESPPDMKESFVCPTSDLPGHEGAIEAIWPEEVPQLRSAANAYLAAVEALHLELLELAAVALGLEDTRYLADRADVESAMKSTGTPRSRGSGPLAPGSGGSGPTPTSAPSRSSIASPASAGCRCSCSTARGWTHRGSTGRSS